MTIESNNEQPAAHIGDPLLKGMVRIVCPFSDTTASWLLDSNF